MGRIILAAAFAGVALIGCGGSEPQQLTDAEKQAIADSVVAGFSSIGAITSGARPGPPETGYSAAVNSTAACPGSGHIHVIGNTNVSCPNPPTPGSCTIGSLYNMHFGDPVNNLDDCTYASGFIVDGSITLGISGTDLAVKLSLTGQVSVNRRGPSGGLVQLDSCWILLTANTPANTLTGSQVNLRGLDFSPDERRSFGAPEKQ